ncbi:unnamed protein product [Peniophora sp. CBMAI 1063]|nr:unnamed protein product [Peniophora sp. CBMAI 1063]
MSLLSLSSITPSVSELRDSDLSDGFTIVLPKSITPSTTRISAQISAHLDKAKQRFNEGGFKIGWDDLEPKSRSGGRKAEKEREESRRSRSGERQKSKSRSRSREHTKKKRRSSSQDTLSSLSDGPELDLSSYTRNLNLKRQLKTSKPRARSPPRVRPEYRTRTSKPVIPPRSRERRSRSSSVTSSSEEDERAESTSESEAELERVARQLRATTPRADSTLFIEHGRTDVLPALPLDPHSAFLAAYRLTHLTAPSPPNASSPHSPSSPSFSPFNPNPTKPHELPSNLPLHLLPTFTPSEKRARRLALLLDSSDRAIRDWAMEEYIKLSSSGRTLVAEGVFALPSSRPSSPSLTTTLGDEPEMSDFEDASVSEAGFGMKRRKRADTFQKAEDEERGRKLEALAARLESTREMAEEREELERERAWAQETFGRWVKDGRADTVFRQAASILDEMLRHMAKEDGEEWAMVPVAAQMEHDDGNGRGKDEESIRPSESASVADYGGHERTGQPTPTPVEGTVTESSGMETQVTMKRAPVVEPVAAAPVVAAAPTPKLEPAKPARPAAPITTKPEVSKPALPATVSKIPKLAAPDKRDVAPEPKRQDSSKRDEKVETREKEKEKAIAPDLKRSSSKRDEPGKRDETGKREETKRPNGPAPELKRADSSSRPQIKRADSNSKSKPPAAPPAPAPIPKSTPLPPKTPLKPHPPPQSTAQTTSQESQESGTSTIAAPPKPNFVPTTSSPAVPTRAEPQFESYADFYERDPRRARDDRPIRPHPAYAGQFNGPKPTPEEVYGSYADFYKGRSVAGSTVSRRSRRSDKGKDGKRKDKERESRDKDKEKERRRREREPDAETLPHSILIRTQPPSLPRRSSKSKKPLSPSPEHDPLEDIAVSSRISLETGRLTTPGQSEVASPIEGGGAAGAGGTGRRRRGRRDSDGLTTPPQSRGPSPPPRQPSPPPPPPKASNKNATTKGGKKSGKAQRLRGGAPSPSPPPIRQFGAIVPQPPPSEATEGPLIPLESDAGTTTQDAAGEAAFGVLDPLPPIQFWIPPLSSTHNPNQLSFSSDSETDEDFPTPRPVPPTVFLALGARRACVPYTPAFTGLDTRVVRPVSARERLAIRDAGAVLVRLGARVKESGEGEVGMWSLSWVGGV